jgi:hypothetical protein
LFQGKLVVTLFKKSIDLDQNGVHQIVFSAWIVDSSHLLCFGERSKTRQACEPLSSYPVVLPLIRVHDFKLRKTQLELSLNPFWRDNYLPKFMSPAASNFV